jgi:ribonuclease P protein component
MKRSLSRDFRLKKSEDIKTVIKEGAVVSCLGIKWFILPNGRDCSRFAVTLKRGYGKAVDRNRVKRQIKEIYRNNKSVIKSGFDMVCMVFPREMNFKERSDQLLTLIKRAGLLEEVRDF